MLSKSSSALSQHAQCQHDLAAPVQKKRKDGDAKPHAAAPLRKPSSAGSGAGTAGSGGNQKLQEQFRDTLNKVRPHERPHESSRENLSRLRDGSVLFAHNGMCSCLKASSRGAHAGGKRGTQGAAFKKKAAAADHAHEADDAAGAKVREHGLARTLPFLYSSAKSHD